MGTPGRNDLCHCNSGKKYKKCCLDLDQTAEKRLSIARTPQTLRERNLTLLAATTEIFHLERPWDKVKEGMSDARIRAFYEFVADLWPPDTPIETTLPAPEGNLRALYLGENMPEAMVQNVFRFSLYADQIVLTHPFENPNRIREQFNPIAHPEEWRAQTLRTIYQLHMVAPWIVAGIVMLIPDPGDFNYPLMIKMFKMAEARLGKEFLTENDVEMSGYREVMQKQFFLSPPSYLARMARETIPGISDKEVQDLLDYAAEVRKSDPLLINDTLDKMPGQMTTAKTGANLEMGLYICQNIGAFPYTNLPFRWKEILSAGKELDPLAQVWSPLTKAFHTLDFKFLNNVDSHFAVEMRNEGRLAGFRAYLRKLWNMIDGDIDPGKAERYALDFRDELTAEYDRAKADWNSIDRDLMKWAIPAIAGLMGSVGAIATGHLGLAVPSGGFVIKGVNELIQAQKKRAEFRLKTPMSVLIDLEANR
ncbi:MAG: SEC-C metal-binding domain-containing protein [Acidobacteriota bacterium]